MVSSQTSLPLTKFKLQLMLVEKRKSANAMSASHTYLWGPKRCTHLMKFEFRLGMLRFVLGLPLLDSFCINMHWVPS
jgi:hypothetical protein